MNKTVCSISSILRASGEKMSRERFQEPTIQVNGNGSFFIRPWVDIRNGDGLLERKKRTFVLGDSTSTKKELAQARRAVMDTINRQEYVIKSQLLFSELITIYRNRHIAKISVPAQKKYESLLKCHILPEFGKQFLYQITTIKVESWLASKQKSWNTKTDIRNVLSSVFTQAKIWKLYEDDNPIEHVYVGRKKLVREKVKLTDEQTILLLAALPPDVRLMACIGLFCGLRVSEILGLREKHIDFNAGLIRVSERFYRGDVDTVKTNAANRSIPMGYMAEEIKQLIKGEPERHLIQIATKPQYGQKSAYCRDDRDINQHFLRPAAKKIGCYRLGFGWHSLRREAITAFNATLGVTQAMKLGGHTSIQMSENYTLAEVVRQGEAIKQRQELLMGKGSDVVN